MPIHSQRRSSHPIHYNQFGYNLGGPFYIPGKFNTDKNKVFWYWGQEWVRYHWTESGSTVGTAGLLTVPSVLMRQGNFSELLDPSNIFYNKQVIIKDTTQRQSISGQYYSQG